MDSAVWDQTFDQDVIEENAMNERACTQVLQLLISGANAEILELEEDLIILQSQLAWADESWSETCSAALNGKIDCLDISLRRLENADARDEHDFGSCLLSSHCKPAEKIHELLQPLLENYFHQEHEQNEQTVGGVVSKDDLSLETEKKVVSEKEKHVHTIIKDVSSDASGQETDESSEKKKLAKSDGSDGLGSNNSASKERNLVTIVKSAGKGRIVPKTFEPSSASSFDASKQVDSPSGKNSRIDSKVKRCKEVKGQKSTDQIRILKSSFRRRKSDISEAAADHPVEFRSCALHEVPEEYDVNLKLSEGLDSALINNIEPPLSSFIIGKKRKKAPQKLKSSDLGLTNIENEAVDVLLQLLNNKKEVKGKSKLAAIVTKSNPNLSLRPQKQSGKRVHQQKQIAKRVLDVDKEKKIKRQNSPGVEEAKMLKSIQMSLTESFSNTTASTNVENPSETKCLLTGDSVNSETPRPCPEARVLDLTGLRMEELRAIAKQQKMRGYSKLRKSKLIEELSSKLMVRGGGTKSHCETTEYAGIQFAEEVEAYRRTEFEADG